MKLFRTINLFGTVEVRQWWWCSATGWWGLVADPTTKSGIILLIADSVLTF